MMQMERANATSFPNRRVAEHSQPQEPGREYPQLFNSQGFTQRERPAESLRNPLHPETSRATPSSEAGSPRVATASPTSIGNQNNSTVASMPEDHAKRQQMTKAERRREFLKRCSDFPRPPSEGEFFTVSSLSPNTSIVSAVSSCQSCVSLEMFQQKKGASRQQQESFSGRGRRNASFTGITFSSSAASVASPLSQQQQQQGGSRTARRDSVSSSRITFHRHSLPSLSNRTSPKSKAVPASSAAKKKVVHGRNRVGSEAASTRFVAVLSQACKKRAREDEERQQKKRSNGGHGASVATIGLPVAIMEGTRKKARLVAAQPTSDGVPPKFDNGGCPLSSHLRPLERHDLQGAVAQESSKPAQEFEKRVLEMSCRDDTQLVVVRFTAKWCSACRTMEPLIEKFQKGKMKQLYKDRVKFVTVDVEEDPSDPNSASSASFSSSSSSVNHEIVSAWKVESLPSFCLWKQGRMVERLSGANPFRLFLAIHQHAGNNATSEDPTAASGAPLTGSTNFSY